MRFIFGLVAGALATLFIAAAFDAPADHLVGKLVHTTARLSDRLIETEMPDAVRASDPVEMPEPVAVTEPVLEQEQEQEQEQEPEVLPQEATDSPIAATSTESLEPVPVADVLSDGAPQTAGQQAATAWGPFHSEASANGFARRLSRETGRPFSVEKRGPGDYAVTFVYAGEADLSAMREQIAEVTGIPQT